MENSNFGFEELELWKKVREFKIEVCKERENFLQKKNSDSQIKPSVV